MECALTPDSAAASGDDLLTENDVVEAVVKHLKGKAYVIESALTTTERGFDIVAISPVSSRKLLVEAKGGTSSKPGTARYGLPFDAKQARSHVAVAFLWAAMVRENPEFKDAEIALAFPEDANHQKLIENLTEALKALGILVFFVDGTRRVTLKVGCLDSTESFP